MFPRVAGPGSGRAYLLLQELLLLVDSGEQRVQRVQVGGTLQLVVQVVLHADIHVVLSFSPVLSFSSYNSGWTSMSVYRPRMDQASAASLFKHLVVVQGVCDLIGFPSETRRTDYLDRRGGRVTVPIHYSIHLINPSQRCDSGACCVTFCLRLSTSGKGK